MIAVYLGLVLVVAACWSVLVVYKDALGNGGVLTLALAFLAGYLVGSEMLRRRRLTQPAGVVETVSVVWVCVAVFAVQKLSGLWPDGSGDGGEIHAGFTAIAIAALVTGALLLAWRPEPLLLVAIAGATAPLALDLAEAVYGAKLDDLSGRQGTTFLLPLGLGWIAIGLWLDATRRRRYATWAHWCGLLITGIAVAAMLPKTVWGFTVIGILGAISLFFSAFARHWSFTVVGAVGVLVAAIATMGEFGRAAPFLIALVGIALVYVGLRWSRWREAIRAATLARMPVAARGFVERLAP